MQTGSSTDRTSSLPLPNSSHREKTITLGNMFPCIPLFTHRENQNENGKKKLSATMSSRELVPSHLHWMNFDYTKLPHLAQGKRSIRAFNNKVFRYLTKSIKSYKTNPIPTAESIDTLGLQLLKKNVDHSKTAKIRVGYFTKTKDYSHLIQCSGKLWQEITDRLIYLRCKLNEYLSEEGRRTMWTDTLTLMLEFLIKLPNSDLANTKNSFHSSPLPPLKLLIDRLNNGIEDSKINQIVRLATGGKNWLGIKNSLRRWNAIFTKHLWRQSEKSTTPLEKINLEQAINSLIFGNQFSPEKFFIQDKAIDLTALLFSDPRFQAAIVKNLENSLAKEPENAVKKDLTILINCLKSDEILEKELYQNGMEHIKLDIDWFEILTKPNTPGRNIFFSKEDEGDKVQSLMKFLSIPENQLFSDKRKRKLKEFIRSYSTPSVKETVKGKEKEKLSEIDENQIKDEVKLQQTCIYQLYKFLRVNLSQVVHPKKFKKIAFEHFCHQINHAGVTPEIQNIPETVKTLLKWKRESDETKQDQDIQRLFTLVRLSSISCFGKASNLSMALFPRLYNYPYFAKPGKFKLYLNFHRNGSFTVIQERTHLVSLIEKSDSPHHPLVKDSCFAKIVFRWTITDKVTSGDKIKPLPTATLNFPKIQFNEKAAPQDMEEILDILSSYRRLEETDNIDPFEKGTSSSKKKRKGNNV